MRGFGLTYDGDESFATTQPVVLGGVAISRAVKVSKAGNYSALAGHVRQHHAAHDHGRRRLRRQRGPELRLATRAGRRHLQRRHADRRRRHVGRGRQPVDRRRELNRGPARSSTARSRGTGNFQRDPFGNAAAADRPRGQLLRLHEHADARAGRDEVAAALRRRGPRRGRRDRRPAGRRGQDRRRRRSPPRPTSPGIPAGVGCTVANWAPLFDAATCAASPAPALTPEQPAKLPVTTLGLRRRRQVDHAAARPTWSPA